MNGHLHVSLVGDRYCGNAHQNLKHWCTFGLYSVDFVLRERISIHEDLDVELSTETF